MKAPSGKAWAWACLAAGAAVTLLAMAMLSPDRQQSMAAFAPAGPLRDVEVSLIRSISLKGKGTERRYGRAADGLWRGTVAGVEEGRATKVEPALRLMRNAAAERDFDRAEPDFGLEAPVLEVTIEGPAGTVEVAFGATNPIGMARYVRLRRPAGFSWHLLPSYVADGFERLLHGEAAQ